MAASRPSNISTPRTCSPPRHRDRRTQRQTRATRAPSPPRTYPPPRTRRRRPQLLQPSRRRLEKGGCLSRGIFSWAECQLNNFLLRPCHRRTCALLCFWLWYRQHLAGALMPLRPCLTVSSERGDFRRRGTCFCRAFNGGNESARAQQGNAQLPEYRGRPSRRSVELGGEATKWPEKVMFYLRKKVVATAAVIQTRRHTAFFETGALSHRDTSRCVLAFQSVPCRHGRHGGLFRLGFRRDILCGVYLYA